MGNRLPLVPIASARSSLVEWPAVAEQLRQKAAARQQASALERCELCAADIAAEHGHLVNVSNRALLCVCRPCYLLFTRDRGEGGRFRAVPDRYQLLPEFESVADRWDSLDIPIGLAFLFRNSATGRTTAFYPSPAGATESELALGAWEALVSAMPALATLAEDVEALLVRTPARSPQSGGAADARVTALIVPIDACYELVGRIRTAWRGFQGGDEVWRAIDDFFNRAIARAQASLV